MKLFSKTKKKQNDALLGEIKKTKLALESAYSNFENVIDPDLIDCYIYEVNAIQKRYKFLLKQAKEMDNDYSII
ncbi:YaaL family protein [Anaerocolumna sp. AGMB13025]|uniref:YaaL family protein n=1 Tax=Anaerocolumna sp. AGMB13025 TaxID=3039116 RepID=UPI0024200CD4|nr:YaaL family protein [Anaerocolumna sp. AGMB13025]WFR57548.1 YaaL family protein [Anaerocolumna sp. AGMB13025]